MIVDSSCLDLQQPGDLVVRHGVDHPAGRPSPPHPVGRVQLRVEEGGGGDGHGPGRQEVNDEGNIQE